MLANCGAADPRRVGATIRNHEIWLADIQEQCIFGFDLLNDLGARVDVSKNIIHLEPVPTLLSQPPRPAIRSKQAIRSGDHSVTGDDSSGAISSAYYPEAFCRLKPWSCSQSPQRSGPYLLRPTSSSLCVG
ncbi:hypothetical protein DPEC_G00211090 [Dallia pectoralis]|uniref:Uncharacterized protein n=1 Tax=Dallia pectoralis TaxID=75939 RepID=A0ACC2G5K8_DALPE|nr:hypothetical protein DPEC_G00211090 [Dallia pectoralis]